MTIPLNPNIAASPLYVGGASIEDIRQQYGVQEIIKLASNENPLGPSPLAVAAIQQTAGNLNRYPPMGDESLRTSLARINGHGLQPENFITGNGGCDVLNMLAVGFLSTGDQCVICRPTFPVYEITARRAGADLIYVDLDPENYQYDVEAILRSITSKTRLVYICSPNNPTGSAISSSQIDTLINQLPDDILLLFDEVYHHFTDADEHPQMFKYIQEDKNVVLLHSFSKAYGLAGLRLGYGVAPARLAQYLARIREPFHLNSLTLNAALAALDDLEHVARSVEIVRDGRTWLYGQLLELGLQTWPSQANFILFKPTFDPQEISERLLQRGLIVRPMTQFYLPTHLRVTVGQPSENRQFITALSEILAELGSETGSYQESKSQEDEGEFKF
jgi:histidinol-phosphate aminotransferase